MQNSEKNIFDKKNFFSNEEMQYRISSSQPVICLFWLLLVLSLSSTSIYASEDYIEEDYQEYYDEDYDYEDDLASGDTAPEEEYIYAYNYEV